MPRRREHNILSVEVVTLSAGHLLAFGKGHEEAPATDMDLSFLCRIPGLAENMLVLKLANYWYRGHRYD